MIKACHITTVHPDRYDVRIFERECVSLAKSGIDVTLIVADGKAAESKDGVHIQSIDYQAKNKIDRAINSVKSALMTGLEVDADVYHLHDPELLRIIKPLKRKGKKVIFDSHEFTKQQILSKPYLQHWIRKIASYCYGRYENNALKIVDGIICPCTYEGKDYFSSQNTEKVIIGNFPFVSKYENVVSKRDNNVEKCVCYLGSISKARGIIQMLKAVAKAKRKLVLIGKMDDSLKNELEKMPEYQYVDYKGTMPHEVAIAEASKCSVGLSLLLNDGQYFKCDNLPTKTYEYMMLGMPVVMSDAPYWKKLLEKYTFGLAVNPKDASAVADAINKILSNDTLREKMSDEGRRAIIGEMSWEKESQKLISLYYRIMKVK